MIYVNGKEDKYGGNIITLLSLKNKTHLTNYHLFSIYGWWLLYGIYRGGRAVVFNDTDSFIFCNFI